MVQRIPKSIWLVTLVIAILESISLVTVLAPFGSNSFSSFLSFLTYPLLIVGLVGYSLCAYQTMCHTDGKRQGPLEVSVHLFGPV